MKLVFTELKNAKGQVLTSYTEYVFGHDHVEMLGRQLDIFESAVN